MTTPRFERRRVGNAPLLLAIPSGRPPLPVVLWFHGLGVDKEVHRKELGRLAAEGFLAVAVDAAGHGERRLPDFEILQAAPREEALRMMIRLVEETAGEVPGILQALAAEGLADRARASVVGVSMGGYLAYRAVMAEPKLQAAVSILGSPEWPVGDSPHRHPTALAATALLSITAGRDENVPPAAARRLHAELARLHPEATARYVELPGAAHLMGEADWDRAMAETVGWLSRYGR